VALSLFVYFYVFICAFLCSFNDTVIKDIFLQNSTMMALEQGKAFLRDLPSTEPIIQSIPRPGDGGGEEEGVEGGEGERAIYPEIIRPRGDANHSTNPTPILTL